MKWLDYGVLESTLLAVIGSSRLLQVAAYSVFTVRTYFAAVYSHDMHALLSLELHWLMSSAVKVIR